MDDMLSLMAKKNGETIREHTDKLLDALDYFEKLYGSYFTYETLKSIRYACEYHDYGKAIYIFQKNIKNQTFLNSLSKDEIKSLDSLYKDIGFSKNLPHGYISPAFLPVKQILDELNKECLSNIINAIYYHHDRKEDIQANETKLVLEKDISKRYPKITLFKMFRSLKLNSNSNISLEQWINFAIVMGMLNRFDYYASDVSKDKLPIEIDGSYNDKYLNDYVLEYLNQKKHSLYDCQRYAQSHTNDNIILIASPGFGKTEASILWANGQKLIYTLPLKVSINAMYERLANNYGYDKTKVTLLHSNALQELIPNNDDKDKIQDAILKYDATHKFSYPVTVCTIDQLFTFIYKYHGCEQLLAVLKYSKLVIDEIQSYEPRVLAKLIYGLKILTMIGGSFAIVTATMPPVMLYFIDKLNIPHDTQQKFLMTKNRHKIKISQQEDFDFNQILELSKDKKILIICNTVVRACNVYEILKDNTFGIKVGLLHSNFIQKHRKLLEDDIKKMGNLTCTDTGIWVSTQLVEASLDIDFDILFTEMSTADSLLQRMGRCYRNRTYTFDVPNVYILDNHSGYGIIYNKDIYNRSMEFLMQYDNKYFSENDKIDYIDKVYNVEEIQNTSYFKDIEKNLNEIEHIIPFSYSKIEAKKDFRRIYSYAVIPKSLYDDNVEYFHHAIDVLTHAKKFSRIERDKQRAFIENYVINISMYDSRAKQKSSSIFNGLNYYTISNYKYDFNESTHAGIGLKHDFTNDDNFY